MAQWQRWLNASVLKTESRKRLVGSNPTCVAKKKRGKDMSKEEIEEFKEEHNCSTCTKNIDCKIVRRIDGKLTCIEED